VSEEEKRGSNDCGAENWKFSLTYVIYKWKKEKVKEFETSLTRTVITFYVQVLSS